MAETALIKKGPWSVYRQDTHGSVFEIDRGLSEAFAKARVHKLEENVHKQGYWIGLPENNPQAVPV